MRHMTNMCVETVVRSLALWRTRSNRQFLAGLTTNELTLLRKVSTRVHPRDPMYVSGQAGHYLAVGLSASRAITDLLRPDQINASGSILDFACGYGRVLRFLRAMFPVARVTCAEIDSDALDFCRRVFDVNTVLSGPDFTTLPMPREAFDLIWCGSLITHLDEQSVSALLNMFYECLARDGVCVFTTHGQRAADWLRCGIVSYGLDEINQRASVRQYDDDGYAYADLENSPRYGISLVKRQRMNELLKQAGTWQTVQYLESGWDNHQDVYAVWKR